MFRIKENVVKSYLEEKTPLNNNFFIKSNYSKNTKNKINLSNINDNNKMSNEKNNHRIIKLFDLKNPTKIIDYNSINTSTNISNLNTQINSVSKRHPLENRQLINKINNNNYDFLLSENNVKAINRKKTFNHKAINFNPNAINLKQILKKNSISYVDRKKIKKLNSTSLKFYEIYMQRKNQILNIEDSPENIDSIINEKNKFVDNYISDNNSIFISKNNIKHLTINSSSSNSSRGFSSNYKSKFKKKLKEFKTQRKYGLKQLMNFNPYHYVSNMVRYCNSLEIKNISEKLSDVNGAIFNKVATSKQHFFKNENKSIKKNKVISSFAVSMNNNLSFRGGMVWRILSKITKINGYSSFYNACIFKGYHELWRHYSILIEQLLVKYVEFKWFLEKDKYMKEEVFKEFLTCIKMEVKNDKSFSNKVFLLFDENNNGEINIKIFLFIMELISKSTSEIEKINFYSELFSDIKLKEEIKCINILEMFEIIKHIIKSPNYKKEYKCLYEIFKKEFNNGEKIENNLFISKQKLCLFLLNNKFIKTLIQHFKYQYKYSDIVYNEEINSSFNSTIRNVKKFLNEQNETIQMSQNECDNLENILKAILNKGESKNKIDILEKDIYNKLNDE